LVDRQQKMQALCRISRCPREDRLSKAQAIRQDARTKLEATLNDQQKQQFEALQAKMQERPAATDGRPESGAHRSGRQP